jgi:hypothetical protein
MSEKSDNFPELYSDNVKEIMSSPPGWFIRWGIAIIFSVVFLLLIMSYYIKFPDIISAPISITSDNFPVSVVAKTGGKLTHIIVKDNEIVNGNTVLAIIENSAEYPHVKKIDSILNNFNLNNNSDLLDIIKLNNLHLGNLQQDFINFQKQCSDYYRFLSNDLSPEKTYPLQKPPAFNEQKKMKTKSLELSGNSLINSIYIWKNLYLLISPVRGKLSYGTILKNNQNANAGNIIFTIEPVEKTTTKGIVFLPLKKAEKVKEGQLINIKLDNYPYLEFGMVKARITSISKVPVDSGYILEVNFPEGLKTDYKKSLELSIIMTGTAEIITEEIRLITRIFSPFRFNLKKHP